MFKKKEQEEAEEEELPAPKPYDEAVAFVVKEIPKVEVREAELDGKPVECMTSEEALTEILNTLRRIKGQFDR